MNLETAVAVDSGSLEFKAGLSDLFSSDRGPSVVTPGTVREVKESGAVETDADTLRQAVKDRTVADWDAYEAVLDDLLYDKLGWKVGEEGSFLVTEALFSPRAEQEQLAQLLFERNNVAALHIADSAVLALYAVGKISGIVVDVGHTTIDIAAVLEGQLVAASATRLPFGMHTVSQHLRKLLTGSVAAELSEAALDTFRDSTIQVSESGEVFAALVGKGNAAACEKHALPDGQTIEVQLEGVTAGECLVDGSRLDLDVPSTAAALYLAYASNTDAAVRKAVLENFLVCGGGSAVRGLPQRLMRELRISLPPSAQPGLAQPPEYMHKDTLRYASWMGGAILSKTDREVWNCARCYKKRWDTNVKHLKGAEWLTNPHLRKFARARPFISIPVAC